MGGHSRTVTSLRVGVSWAHVILLGEPRSKHSTLLQGYSRLTGGIVLHVDLTSRLLICNRGPLAVNDKAACPNMTNLDTALGSTPPYCFLLDAMCCSSS